jgi:hypothetical protein
MRLVVYFAYWIPPAIEPRLQRSAKGENIKVAQSQLRHTTPKITLELYAQAVSADQQEADKKVVQMVLPAQFSKKLKARSATTTKQELESYRLWVSGGA